MQTTIDKLGRIVVPKEMRDHLGLKPGVKIEITEQDQQLVLKPTSEEPLMYRKDGILVFSGTLYGDIGQSIQSDRDERVKKVSGF